VEIKLSERWIKESEGLLKLMKGLTSKKERDRLEVINSLLLSLNAIERSIQGWRTWIRNLSIMSQFSLEELKEIDATVQNQAKTIVEFDIVSTKRWKDKFPIIRPSRRIRDRGRGIIV
jgi:hypothetical protein